MTWVERKMGSEFDPEKFCDYTGLRIYQKAVRAGVLTEKGVVDGWRIGYFREDGVCRRFRDATTAELAWIVGNPEAFQSSQIRFNAWIAGFQKN